MADSLDDFFAKKDKKRNKDKSKAVLSAEVLVRELEEGSKPAEPSRKEAKTSAAIELLGLDADDADWRDFEEVEKRDYSGLKVKEMSLQDQNEDEHRRQTYDQAEPAAESTPWRIKDDAATAAAAAAAAATTLASQPDAASVSAAAKAGPTAAATSAEASSDSEKSAAANQTAASATPASDSKTSDQKEASDPSKAGDKESAKPKKYIPPGGRGENGEMRILEPVRLSKTRNTNSHYASSIPNIQDEQAFPSLG